MVTVSGAIESTLPIFVFGHGNDRCGLDLHWQADSTLSPLAGKFLQPNDEQLYSHRRVERRRADFAVDDIIGQLFYIDDLRHSADRPKKMTGDSGRGSAGTYSPRRGRLKSEPIRHAATGSKMPPSANA